MEDTCLAPGRTRSGGLRFPQHQVDEGVKDVEGEACCEPLEAGDHGVLVAALNHRGGVLVCGYGYKYDDVECQISMELTSQLVLLCIPVRRPGNSQYPRNQAG